MYVCIINTIYVLFDICVLNNSYASTFLYTFRPCIILTGTDPAVSRPWTPVNYWWKTIFKPVTTHWHFRPEAPVFTRPKSEHKKCAKKTTVQQSIYGNVYPIDIRTYTIYIAVCKTNERMEKNSCFFFYRRLFLSISFVKSIILWINFKV